MKTSVISPSSIIFTLLMLISLNTSAQNYKPADSDIHGLWMLEWMQWDGEKKTICGSATGYTQYIRPPGQQKQRQYRVRLCFRACGPDHRRAGFGRRQVPHFHGGGQSVQPRQALHLCIRRQRPRQQKQARRQNQQ